MTRTTGHRRKQSSPSRCLRFGHRELRGRMTITKTSTCRLCTAMCPIVVTIEDGRAVAVHGDRDAPLFEGYTCPKGRALPEIHANPKRLLHSLRRRAGRIARADRERRGRRRDRRSAPRRRRPPRPERGRDLHRDVERRVSGHGLHRRRDAHGARQQDDLLGRLDRPARDAHRRRHARPLARRPDSVRRRRRVPLRGNQPGHLQAVPGREPGEAPGAGGRAGHQGRRHRPAADRDGALGARPPAGPTRAGRGRDGRAPPRHSARGAGRRGLRPPTRRRCRVAAGRPSRPSPRSSLPGRPTSRSTT